jgi:tRNA(adenine34) deaminase
MHSTFMREAIKEAQKALRLNEVPIGALIVKDNQIIARSHNLRHTTQSAVAHAEILAIQEACKAVGSWRLDGCTLYVTLEPCPMCAGAVIQSRIETVVFGAYDPKGGSFGTSIDLSTVKAFNHHPVVYGGILEQDCASLLTDFFARKREAKPSTEEDQGEV